MFHKKELKKQIFALVIAAAMVCQTQAVSASVVSLQAGAQNALTAPSLQMAETEEVQTISVDGMQQAETEAKADNSDVALTAGAASGISIPESVPGQCAGGGKSSGST